VGRGRERAGHWRYCEWEGGGSERGVLMRAARGGAIEVVWWTHGEREGVAIEFLDYLGQATYPL
jgi:hypothetical protein